MAEKKREGDRSNGFKVTDKRHFTSEGDSLRDESQEAETEVREETVKTPPAPEKDRAVKPPVSAPAEPGPGGETGGEPVDFTHLVMYLANITSFALGVPDPVTKKKETNLGAASQMIDMLGVLAEKTRGNLTEPEEQILSGILAELKNLYVQASSLVK